MIVSFFFPFLSSNDKFDFVAIFGQLQKSRLKVLYCSCAQQNIDIGRQRASQSRNRQKSIPWVARKLEKSVHLVAVVIEFPQVCLRSAIGLIIAIITFSSILFTPQNSFFNSPLNHSYNNGSYLLAEKSEKRKRIQSVKNPCHSWHSLPKKKPAFYSSQRTWRLTSTLSETVVIRAFQLCNPMKRSTHKNEIESMTATYRDDVDGLCCHSNFPAFERVFHFKSDRHQRRLSMSIYKCVTFMGTFC